MNVMGGACGTDGDSRDVNTVLVVKPEGRDHLEDPRIEGR
jgi:hypothetical protein